jgi:hypothetical protein
MKNLEFTRFQRLLAIAYALTTLVESILLTQGVPWLIVTQIERYGTLENQSAFVTKQTGTCLRLQDIGEATVSVLLELTKTEQCVIHVIPAAVVVLVVWPLLVPLVYSRVSPSVELILESVLIVRLTGLHIPLFAQNQFSTLHSQQMNIPIH